MIDVNRVKKFLKFSKYSIQFLIQLRQTWESQGSIYMIYQLLGNSLQGLYFEREETTFFSLLTAGNVGSLFQRHLTNGICIILVTDYLPKCPLLTAPLSQSSVECLFQHIAVMIFKVLNLVTCEAVGTKEATDSSLLCYETRLCNSLSYLLKNYKPTAIVCFDLPP